MTRDSGDIGRRPEHRDGASHLFQHIRLVSSDDSALGPPALKSSFGRKSAEDGNQGDVAGCGDVLAGGVVPDVKAAACDRGRKGSKCALVSPNVGSVALRNQTIYQF